MRTAIDKAGRVVIPKALRKRAGLEPGMDLDIELNDDGVIRISAPAPQGQIVYREGLPYWQTGRKISVEEIDDAVRAVRLEREERIIRGLTEVDEDCS